MPEASREIGLFTTVRVREGVRWFWSDHLERLEQGSLRFGLALPARDRLESEIATAVADCFDDARVRVLLGREGWSVEARPYRPPEAPWRLAPVSVSPCEDTVRFKTDRRDVYQAAAARVSPGSEPLLVDSFGGLLECTIANVFFVRETTLITPPATGALLAGIARNRVIEQAHAMGIEVREESLDRDAAGHCGGCFVTNALFITHEVAAIEGLGAFEPVPLARALKLALASRQGNPV